MGFNGYQNVAAAAADDDDDDDDHESPRSAKMREHGPSISRKETERKTEEGQRY